MSMTTTTTTMIMIMICYFVPWQWQWPESWREHVNLRKQLNDVAAFNNFKVTSACHLKRFCKVETWQNLHLTSVKLLNSIRKCLTIKRQLHGMQSKGLLSVEICDLGENSRYGKAA